MQSKACRWGMRITLLQTCSSCIMVSSKHPWVKKVVLGFMKERKHQSLKYQDYIDSTRQILNQSRMETKPYRTIVAGREFIVYPNVFSPKYFHDTELFAANLPVKAGEDMLEIGPGTGVISITAAYKGARKVVASDINPDAVRNTQANIKLHNMEGVVEARQGDLYEPLKQNEKFDTIFWNTPFGLIDQENITDLEKAVYDPHYNSTRRFIKEASSHLKPQGRVLIGFSSTLGRLDLLRDFANQAGLTLHMLFEAESQEVHPVKFEIFEGHN
jgi:release factor glutamine methyltransferase